MLVYSIKGLQAFRGFLQRNFKQRSNVNTSVNKRFQAFEYNHCSVPQMLAIDMNDVVRSLSTFPYRVSIVGARLIYWRGFRSFELDQISELEWEAPDSEWANTYKIAYTDRAIQKICFDLRSWKLQLVLWKILGTHFGLGFANQKRRKQQQEQQQQQWQSISVYYLVRKKL